MAASEDARAHGLPDVSEIEETIAAATVDGRDRTKSQLDRVDQSLASVQQELLELVERDLPAGVARHDGYQPDHLRGLLERVDDLRESLRQRRDSAPD